MPLNRRQFLQTTAAVAASLPSFSPAATDHAAAPIKIGSCMIGLPAAKQAGLDGIQVPVKLLGDSLDVADPQTRATYKSQMRETALPICALMMGVLNTYPLATDPRAPRWLEQAIDAAADLGAPAILVAFFGNGDLLDADGHLKQHAIDSAVARLKSAAPRATDANVVLAVENYLDARQNLQLLDRVGRPSVQIWYDVYNTGVTRGYDVPAEIRLLKGRIAQFHFKNGPQFLGDGSLAFPPIATAIRDVSYQGWIVLETSSPTHDPIADARRNADFVRRLFPPNNQ